MSEEAFSLRRVARGVVEEHPTATSHMVVQMILARVSEEDVWEALRQALTPIVEAAFREREAQLSPYVATPVTTQLLASLMSYPSPPATTDRGDSDHSSLATHTGSVAATPSNPADGGGHTIGEPQHAPAAPVRRRTKTSLVRNAAKGWMEQSIRTSHGAVPIGSATFQDLMDATAARRRSAYQSMAKADTLERLAKLLESHSAATVSELPSRILESFVRSNPELG